MLKNSDIIVALCEHLRCSVAVRTSRQLLEFSRILTDYVYRAFLLDVVIRDNYRQQGLGKILMEAIVNHPDLKEIEGLIFFVNLKSYLFIKNGDLWANSTDYK